VIPQKSIAPANHRLSAALGLALAFGWTTFFIGKSVTSHQLTNARDDAVTILAEWSVVIVLAVIAFKIQRRPLSYFGLRGFGWRDLLAMLAALAGTFILAGIAGIFVRGPQSATDFQRLSEVPLALRVTLVLTAGICEEFMYRGFGIEELQEFVHNRWLAGALSLAFFTVAHIGRYGLVPALIMPALAGGTLTLLYLWRRNLPVCMLMHAIIDAIFVIVVPMTMANRSA
jgi:membrane protease YdiL (CAAX protease family)